MTMVVMNNPTAMMTLGEFNKNINKLGKSLRQVSTGWRVCDAGDDASGYSISERMRSKIRALDQDEKNTQNGSSMLRIAAGGIDNIVEELRCLKELALNAANDTNTEKDRETMQREYEQKCANIQEIAAQTSYNGKLLLDGRYDNLRDKILRNTTNYSSAICWGRELARQMDGTDPPGGTPRVLPTTSSGSYNISADGVYNLGSFNGTISIASSARNVMLVGGAGNSVRITANSFGAADSHLWLQDVNLSNVGGNPILNLGNTGTNTGTRNVHLLGENYMTSKNAAGYAVIQNGGSANGKLRLLGADGNLTVRDTRTTTAYGATIGGYHGATTGDIEIYASVTIQRNVTAASSGAGIGSGVGYGASSLASCGNIIIGGGAQVNVSVNQNGAAIGTGTNGRCGAIEIQASAGVVATSTKGTGIGTAATNAQCGDIILYSGSKVVATSEGDSAGIGAGSPGQASCNDIVIYSGADVTAVSQGHGAGIGSGGTGSGTVRSSYHSISIYGESRISANHIGAGHGATAAGPVNYLSGQYEIGIDLDNDVELPEANPLVVHHGTRANQATNCYINDMGEQRLCLATASLTTRDKAINAIDVIDGAISYALDEASSLGAYISRLDMTKDNIVVAHENTQASESAIRDADMARAMMEYTKANVLSEASQTMLAQANQTSGSVLSLLQ